MGGQGSDGQVFLFSGFRLDAGCRSLSRGGVPTPITPMVFSTLLALVARAGAVVSKDELICGVWAGRPVGDSTISQTVHTLRRTLADAGSHEHLIETVAGLGYRFVGEVVLEAAPLGMLEIGPSADPQLSAADLKPRLRPVDRRLIAGLGVTGFAAAVAAILALQPRSSQRPAKPPEVVVQAKFENLTGDRSFDYSLARVVEVDLGQSPGIAVLSGRQIAETLEQMARVDDGAPDARLAAQVCLRNNGQAVVEGAVAPIGRR
jgi:DNA-binding winged helix-turn-helix (wHTH) protein